MVSKSARDELEFFRSILTNVRDDFGGELPILDDGVELPSLTGDLTVATLTVFISK